MCVSLFAYLNKTAHIYLNSCQCVGVLQMLIFNILMLRTMKTHKLDTSVMLSQNRETSYFHPDF